MAPTASSGGRIPYHEERVTDLCDRFGYPEIVGDAIRAAAGPLVALEPTALLLVGSTARGEFTWSDRADGGRLLLSDLEFICVTEHTPPDALRAARQALAAAEQRFSADSPRFHVDVAFSTPGLPPPWARGLGWFEAARAGAPLTPGDPTPLGPADPENLSLGLVNQLCSIRLWWILMQMPLAVLRDRSSDRLTHGDRREFMYTLVRNLLDVAAIWLPNAGRFDTGYLARSEAVLANPAVPGSERLPGDFPQRLAEATRRKLSGDLEGDPLDWYGPVIEAYTGLVAFLVQDDSGSDAGLVESVERDWTRLHPVPSSPRFKLYTMASRALSTIRHPFRPGSWDPEAHALAFLLSTHRAALHILSGDARADTDASLDRAELAYAAFTRREPRIRSSDPVARWHELRVDFLQPFGRYFRKVRGYVPGIRANLDRDAVIIRPSQ